jgi:hypothetical protein
MSGQGTDQTHADPGAELLSELESRMVALESRSNDLAARVESAVQVANAIKPDVGNALTGELSSRMVALESRSNDLAAEIKSAVQLGQSIRTDIDKLVASLDPILSEAKSGGAAVDGFARELIGHLVTIVRKVVPHEMAAVDQAVSDATARKPSEAPA